jgi:uroporphyrinogen-III synthase
MPEGSAERARALFAAKPWGWVTFTSPSTVRNLAEALGESLWNDGLPTLDAASIGPTTSAELRKFGAEPAVEADSPGAASLVDSIAAVVVSRRRQSS